MILNQLKTYVTLFFISLLIVSCNNTPITESNSSTSKSQESPEIIKKNQKIIIGDISDKPVKKIQKYQPLADYLADNLKDLDIKIGEVKIAPDIESMIQMLKSGEVDIYVDSLYPAMIVSQESGAKPILRRWKKGIGEYNTVFLVRADSNINSIEQLKGKKIGLEKSFSTSGYFLPIVYLFEKGFDPIEKESSNSTINNDEIAYVFTRKDENTIQWLISNKIDAGAIDNGSFSELPQESQKKLSVIAETEAIARQVVLIRNDLDSQQQEAIKNLLLELDKTSEGKEILEKFENTTKFDDFPASDWERMQELYELFKNNN